MFSEEDSPPAPAPAPAAAVPARVTAALDLQPSDDEEFHPGELFAKHLQKPKDSSDTGTTDDSTAVRWLNCSISIKCLDFIQTVALFRCPNKASDFSRAEKYSRLVDKVD